MYILLAAESTNTQSFPEYAVYTLPIFPRTFIRLEVYEWYKPYLTNLPLNISSLLECCECYKLRIGKYGGR